MLRCCSKCFPRASKLRKNSASFVSWPSHTGRRSVQFMIWRHKLNCMHVYKDLPCKSVCDVKSGIEKRPLWHSHETNGAYYFVDPKTFKKQRFVKKNKTKNAQASDGKDASLPASSWLTGCHLTVSHHNTTFLLWCLSGCFISKEPFEVQIITDWKVNRRQWLTFLSIQWLYSKNPS